MRAARWTQCSRSGALVIAALAAGTGCSAIFVRPEASRTPDEAPRCAESSAAPVVDTVVAGTALTFGIAGLGAALSCSPDCAENIGPALAIMSGLVFLGTAASAVHGFHSVRSCRNAIASWCGAHDCGARAAGGEPGQRLRSDASAREPGR